MPFVCTPRDVGKAPGCDFHGAFRAVGDVHGCWDYKVSAACFTKFIEQLSSLPIGHGASLKTLWVVSAVGGEGRGKNLPRSFH